MDTIIGSEKSASSIKTDFIPFQNIWLQTLIISILAIVLYANTYSSEYAFDDGIVIFENFYTKQGFAGIGKILTTDSFQGFLGDLNNKLLSGGRYRPLSIVTFAIEYELWGLNPHYGHLVNTLFYALTCGILFLLFRKYIVPNKPDIAFIAAFLFTIHPIHTEAVANLKGRDEILAGLFLITTLYGALAYCKEQKNKLLWATIGIFSFILSLLAKENALTLLAILPLTLYFFTDAKPIKIAGVTLPILLLIIVYFVMRVKLTGFSLSATNNQEIMNNAYLYAKPAEKWATIFYVLGLYLKLSVFPHPMSYDYSFNQIPYRNFGSPEAILAFLANAALFAWAVWEFRKKSIYAYGILFYFLSISIVSNIVIDIGAFLADRFLYQASIGLSLVFAALLVEGAKKVGTSGKTIVWASLIVIGFLGGAKTIARNAQWKNNETLFFTDVKTCPNSAKTNRACANLLLKKARTEADRTQKAELLNQAIPYLNNAVAIYPGYIDVWVDLGLAYLLTDRFGAADSAFKQAAAINPIEHNLRIINASISVYYSEKGYDLAKNQSRFEEGRACLEKAVEYDKNNVGAWNTLGIVCGLLSMQKNSMELYERSIFALRKSVEIAPKEPNYWFDLSVSYQNGRDFANAVAALEEVLKLKPDHEGAKKTLETLRPLVGK